MSGILRNALKTPDGTVITSRHRHDYVTHTDTNGKEYILRIRSYYKECIISTCMYYPEIWYDWSQFELSLDIHHRDTKRSIAILQLSLFHIPKCVFLCQALCDLYENYDKVTLFRQEKKGICNIIKCTHGNYFISYIFFDMLV